MKRSEMILIMRTVLKFNHADDAYAFQRGEMSLGALADRLMPSILDRIEKEGMSPPPIMHEGADTWDEESVYYEYKWENE